MRFQLRHQLNGFIDALEFLWHKIAGHVPSQFCRRWMFKLAGGKIGAGSVIYGGCEIRVARKIVIGCGTSIGHRCILDGRGGLRIGDNVNLSTESWIWTSQHDSQSRTFAAISAGVEIDDFVWLSGRTIVLPGRRIGRGAVVAAGGVVTRDVAPFDIVAGVPAKAIGRRREDLQYSLGSSIPFI